MFMLFVVRFLDVPLILLLLCIHYIDAHFLDPQARLPASFVRTVSAWFFRNN